MPKQKVLIVADDFGADSLTNTRIASCYEKGWISTSSVMVTMPGFLEVVHWYKTRDSRPRIGIHLDLDSGSPVSEIWGQLFGQEKLFYRGGWVRAEGQNLVAIEKELDAQIRKFLDHGLILGHIDSHHHIHTRFPVAKIVVKLAQRYGVRLRVAGNVLYPTTFHKRTYRSLLNGYFNRNARSHDHIRYFTGLKEFVERQPMVADTIELMTHPAKTTDLEFFETAAFQAFLQKYSLII